MEENIQEPTRRQWEHSNRLLQQRLAEWQYARVTFWKDGAWRVLEGTLLDDIANFQLRLHNADGSTGYVPYRCLHHPFRVQIKRKDDHEEET